MKPELFWWKVGKRPELLRIMRCFRGQEGNMLEVWPELVASNLSPEAITETIEYMTFVPWRRLDLEAGGPVARELSIPLASVEAYHNCSIEWDAWWHVGSERPFTRLLSSTAGADEAVACEGGDSETVLYARLSVSQMLAEVKNRGGILDAAVRIRLSEVVCKERHVAGQPEGNLLKDINSARRTTEGYQVFRPKH